MANKNYPPISACDLRQTASIYSSNLSVKRIDWRQLKTIENKTINNIQLGLSPSSRYSVGVATCKAQPNYTALNPIA